MLRLSAISSLRTFEIGHPTLAAAAASSIFAMSAPAAVAVVGRTLFLRVLVSKVISQGVSMDSGVMLGSASCAATAMLKQLAWAAAMSSSGFVPGAVSKRVLKLYGVPLITPLATP